MKRSEKIVKQNSLQRKKSEIRKSKKKAKRLKKRENSDFRISRSKANFAVAKNNVAKKIFIFAFFLKTETLFISVRLEKINEMSSDLKKGQIGIICAGLHIEL